MPVADLERDNWLKHVDEDPIDAAGRVASLVQGDLESLAPGQHIRVGTRVLTEIAARSLITSLLSSVDHVELAALARQYITGAVVEGDGDGLTGINVDN